MRVWIETGKLGEAVLYRAVTLRVRVWIETAKNALKGDCDAVTLRVRVWIETTWILLPVLPLWSPSA